VKNNFLNDSSNWINPDFLPVIYIFTSILRQVRFFTVAHNDIKTETLLIFVVHETDNLVVIAELPGILKFRRYRDD
jgi:hypothetical protein